MPGNSNGSEVFLTASSSLQAGDSPCLPAPSIDSENSVDSQELQSLLDELQIYPSRGKRRLDSGSDSDVPSSPSTSPPHLSPRLNADNQSAIAVPALAAHPVAPPPPPPPPQHYAGGAAAEPEVIDLLDSSESDSDEDWHIAAPGTARKRIVVDSEEDGDVDDVGDKAASIRTAVLPPFLAAIPGLGATPPPPRQQQQPTAALPPHGRPVEQQYAAPPAPRSTSSRPLSASAFKKQREELTTQLFREFNRTVFQGRLPRDLELKWNSRLLTTAGLTHYRREIPDDPYAPPIYSARVELSSKVLDSFSKLERTLCHELCHVAAWLLDHTAKPPHGPVFKAWADRAMRLYSHMDITTCHAYEIFYPFRWQCTNSGCLQEYGRHSNSIDISKKVCGACRAPLAFLGRFKLDGTPAKQRSASSSKFIQFVKENHAEIRKALPAGTPQKVVMQHISAKYAEARQRS